MSDIATIDCGYLATVQAMLEDNWTDPITNNDLLADVVVGKAVLENQQVKMTELNTPGKNKKVSLEWLQKCDVTTQECSTDCTIDGDDATPICKEYEMTCLRETSFKVPVKEYRSRTIDKQKSEAFNMGVHMKAMDEWVANYILLGIDANAGVNAFIGSPGNVVGTTTYIAANYWNENIFGYFKLVEAINKFRGTYLIDGQNMYMMLWNKMMESGNADGKGGAAKVTSIKTYQDIVNLINDYAKTYMLHKTAVAFKSRTWYPNGAGNAQKLPADTLAYSIPSFNLQGINYDVFVQSTCLNNEYYDAVKIQLHGLFAVNPAPCSETNTGILAFECGAGA